MTEIAVTVLIADAVMSASFATAMVRQGEAGVAVAATLYSVAHFVVGIALAWPLIAVAVLP